MISSYILPSQASEFSIHDLFSTAKPISYETKSFIGLPLNKVQVYQKDVFGTISSHLSFSKEGLEIQHVENDTHSTYEHLNAKGKQVNFKDAEGKITTFHYDALGRFGFVRLPNKDSARMQYDSEGRVLQVLRNSIGKVQDSYDPTTGLLLNKRLL